MAYYDERGNVTIDRDAANKDIGRIQEAIHRLEASRSAIRNLMTQAGGMKSDTAEAVVSQSKRLENSLNAIISRLNETISYIRQTLNKYQAIDEENARRIREEMAAFANAHYSDTSHRSGGGQTSGSSSGSSGGGHSSGGGRHTGSSGSSSAFDAFGSVFDGIGSMIGKINKKK